MRGQGEEERSFKIHRDHFVNVEREGDIANILAHECNVGDTLLAISLESGEKVKPEEFAKLKPMKITSIETCKEGEIGVPVNIRTPSLTFIANEIYSSSRFYPEAPKFTHDLACLAYKIHSKGAQVLQDASFGLGLNKISSAFMRTLFPKKN